VAPYYLEAAPLNIDLSLANLPHADTERSCRYSLVTKSHRAQNLNIQLAYRLTGSRLLTDSNVFNVNG
jgi:hypothetical protein